MVLDERKLGNLLTRSPKKKSSAGSTGPLETPIAIWNYSFGMEVIMRKQDNLISIENSQSDLPIKPVNDPFVGLDITENTRAEYRSRVKLFVA